MVSSTSRTGRLESRRCVLKSAWGRKYVEHIPKQRKKIA